MHEYIKSALVFLTAFVISAVLCYAIKLIAPKFGLVVYPRSDRWHKRPTPILGGAGIYLSLVITYILLIRQDGEIFPLILIGSFVFLAGLIDDLKEISPPTKFLLQLLAGLLLIHSGFLMEFSQWYILNFLLSIFWLVGITNAFNLLDNMDGLSSGIALIVTIFLSIFFSIQNLTAHLLLCSAFGGAQLGFLIYNFNPASIFMGDAGSLFTGFFIAGLALTKSFHFTSNIFYVILVPAFILLVPIFDTTFVTITRKLSGKPISVGGKDHTSHRLVSIGLSEKEAVLVLYGFSIFAGLLAFVVYKFSLHISIVFIYLTILIFLFIGIYLYSIRQKIDREKEKLNGPLIPVLVDIAFKKRIFEIVMDITLFIISYYSALLLRFEGVIPEPFIGNFLKTLPLMIIIKLSSLYALGIYGGVWRYYGISDFVRLTQGLTLGSLLFIAVIAIVFRFEGFSRSAVIIDLLLSFILLNSTRLSFRVMDRILRQRIRTGRRVLIYGAGDGGELILREIMNNKELNLYPVGFIDDDLTKIGRKIHGVPILGDFTSLHKIVNHFNVEEVILSTGKITHTRMANLSNFCKEKNIRLRKLSIKLED